MGDGISIPKGVPYQAPIQEAGKIEDILLKEVKTEAQPSEKPAEKSQPANDKSQKLEQKMNGTARQAELQGKLPSKTEAGQSIKAAEKILGNTSLSNEAKIAQLQKAIEKTDKAEFALFMKKYPNFSTAQKELIHSAITESPKIMGRVASELNQSEQLTIIMNAVKYPLHGKTEKEENKRLERFDKGVAEWMKQTDVDTLNKALDGRSVDLQTSAKLFGVLSSDPAGLIIGMGHDKGRLLGDHLEIATEMINLKYGGGSSQPATRDELESYAASRIVDAFSRTVNGGSGRRSE